MSDIVTISELRRAIVSCDMVLICVSFGVFEKEVKISKREAIMIVDSIREDATPESFEIGTDRFGYVCKNNFLHMG